MKFEYEAFDRKGERFRKTINAENWDEATTKIRARGYLPLTVSGITRGEEDARKQRSVLRRLVPRVPWPRHKDVIYFTRRMATLLGSGISVGRSLEILKNQFYGQPMEKVVSDVREALDRGRSFADSFAEHPRTFGEFYRAVVHAGEFGGDLDGSLRRLADQLELARARKRKLVSSLIYPVIVILLSFTIVTIIATFIIPFFREVYESSGMTELPALTEGLLKVNQTFLDCWWILALLITAVVSSVVFGRKTKKGRYAMDLALLRIPVVGGMIRRHNLAWFHRTLGAMQESGVGLIEGLEVVRRVVNNTVLKEAAADIRRKVSEGATITDVMNRNKIFDVYATSMVDVGEESGRLSDMMYAIADSYDEDLDTLYERIDALFTPATIVVLGVMVAVTVVALLLPYFKYIQSLTEV